MSPFFEIINLPFFQGSNGLTGVGVGGIHEAFRSCRERPLEKTQVHLLGASHAFTGGQGRHDDTSALLLERGA
jgi:hypothetical protein